MSSDKYPVGTTLRTRGSREVDTLWGKVIPNRKLPGDICVEWETGQMISCDQRFIDQNFEITPAQPWLDELLNTGSPTPQEPQPGGEG